LKWVQQANAYLSSNRLTVRAFFRRFDRDGDGSLTVGEACDAVKQLKGISLTDDEVQALMRFWDTDGSGEVSYAEFTDGLKYSAGGRTVSTSSITSSPASGSGSPRRQSNAASHSSSPAPATLSTAAAAATTTAATSVSAPTSTSASASPKSSTAGPQRQRHSDSPPTAASSAATSSAAARGGGGGGEAGSPLPASSTSAKRRSTSATHSGTSTPLRKVISSSSSAAAVAALSPVATPASSVRSEGRGHGQGKRALSEEGDSPAPQRTRQQRYSGGQRVDDEAEEEGDDYGDGAEDISNSKNYSVNTSVNTSTHNSSSKRAGFGRAGSGGKTAGGSGGGGGGGSGGGGTRGGGSAHGGSNTAVINDSEDNSPERQAYDKWLGQVNEYLSVNRLTARAFYKRFDKDGDGRLTLSEVAEAIKRFKGIELSPTEIAALVRYWDADKSGDVSYQEFTAGLKYNFQSSTERHAAAKRVAKRASVDQSDLLQGHRSEADGSLTLSTGGDAASLAAAAGSAAAIAAAAELEAERLEAERIKTPEELAYNKWLLQVNEFLAAKRLTARSFYKMFDRNGDGLLSLAEVAEAIGRIKGFDLTMEEIAALVRFWDTDKSGDVSFTEFTRGLRYRAVDRKEVEKRVAARSALNIRTPEEGEQAARGKRRRKSSQTSLTGAERGGEEEGAAGSTAAATLQTTDAANENADADDSEDPLALAFQHWCAWANVLMRERRTTPQALFRLLNPDGMTSLSPSYIAAALRSELGADDDLVANLLLYWKAQGTTQVTLPIFTVGLKAPRSASSGGGASAGGNQGFDRESSWGRAGSGSGIGSDAAAASAVTSAGPNHPRSERIPSFSQVESVLKKTLLAGRGRRDTKPSADNDGSNEGDDQADAAGGDGEGKGFSYINERVPSFSRVMSKLKTRSSQRRAQQQHAEGEGEGEGEEVEEGEHEEHEEEEMVAGEDEGEDDNEGASGSGRGRTSKGSGFSYVSERLPSFSKVTSRLSTGRTGGRSTRLRGDSESSDTRNAAAEPGEGDLPEQSAQAAAMGGKGQEARGPRVGNPRLQRSEDDSDFNRSTGEDNSSTAEKTAVSAGSKASAGVRSERLPSFSKITSKIQTRNSSGSKVSSSSKSNNGSNTGGSSSSNNMKNSSASSKNSNATKPRRGGRAATGLPPKVAALSGQEGGVAHDDEGEDVEYVDDDNNNDNNNNNDNDKDNDIDKDNDNDNDSNDSNNDNIDSNNDSGDSNDDDDASFKQHNNRAPVESEDFERPDEMWNALRMGRISHEMSVDESQLAQGEVGAQGNVRQEVQQMGPRWRKTKNPAAVVAAAGVAAAAVGRAAENDASGAGFKTVIPDSLYEDVDDIGSSYLDDAGATTTTTTAAAAAATSTHQDILTATVEGGLASNIAVSANDNDDGSSIAADNKTAIAEEQAGRRGQAGAAAEAGLVRWGVPRTATTNPESQGSPDDDDDEQEEDEEEEDDDVVVEGESKSEDEDVLAASGDEPHSAATGSARGRRERGRNPVARRIPTGIVAAPKAGGASRKGKGKEVISEGDDEDQGEDSSSATVVSLTSGNTSNTNKGGNSGRSKDRKVKFPGEEGEVADDGQGSASRKRAAHRAPTAAKAPAASDSSSKATVGTTFASSRKQAKRAPTGVSRAAVKGQPTLSNPSPLRKAASSFDQAALSPLASKKIGSAEQQVAAPVTMLMVNDSAEVPSSTTPALALDLAPVSTSTPAPARLLPSTTATTAAVLGAAATATVTKAAKVLEFGDDGEPLPSTWDRTAAAKKSALRGSNSSSPVAAQRLSSSNLLDSAEDSDSQAGRNSSPSTPSRRVQFHHEVQGGQGPTDVTKPLTLAHRRPTGLWPDAADDDDDNDEEAVRHEWDEEVEQPWEEEEEQAQPWEEEEQSQNPEIHDEHAFDEAGAEGYAETFKAGEELHFDAGEEGMSNDLIDEGHADNDDDGNDDGHYRSRAHQQRASTAATRGPHARSASASAAAASARPHNSQHAASGTPSAQQRLLSALKAFQSPNSPAEKAATDTPTSTRVSSASGKKAVASFPQSLHERPADSGKPIAHRAPTGVVKDSRSGANSGSTGVDRSPKRAATQRNRSNIKSGSSSNNNSSRSDTTSKGKGSSRVNASRPPAKRTAAGGADTATRTNRTAAPSSLRTGGHPRAATAAVARIRNPSSSNSSNRNTDRTRNSTSNSGIRNKNSSSGNSSERRQPQPTRNSQGGLRRSQANRSTIDAHAARQGQGRARVPTKLGKLSRHAGKRSLPSNKLNWNAHGSSTGQGTLRRSRTQQATPSNRLRYSGVSSIGGRGQLRHAGQKNIQTQKLSWAAKSSLNSRGSLTRSKVTVPRYADTWEGKSSIPGEEALRPHQPR
jgi:Ca2+-binding EF-hand superfamily protein